MTTIKGTKILLAFPQQDQQTGLFILRAMKDLGAIVQVVDAKRQPRQTAVIAKKFQPEVIFMSRTKQLIPVVRGIKKNMPNVILACWNVDKRNHVKEFPKNLIDLFCMMDIMYTIAKGNVPQYEELFKEYGRNILVRHLQQGCDPLTHKTEIVTPEDHEIYDCDVMFAGSLASCGGMVVQRQREGLITRLESEPIVFKRYGQTGNRITDTPANKAHLCSKIVLGHNGWPSCDTSMSVRDYKIMASGGFLLTQWCKGIKKWFEVGPGKMCDVYTDNEDCVKKIHYYLERPELRQQMAQYGQKIVHEQHKYIDRIATIGDDFAEARKMK